MELGDRFIDFNLLGVDDKFCDSTMLSNKKKIVVFFTCNHCPYVHAYEERIISLQKDFLETVDFIGINSNDDKTYPEDSFEKMQTRSAENNFNFMYLRDPKQEIALSYGATHTPHFFLFNKERILVYKGKLDDNWSDVDKVKKRYLKDAILDDEFKPEDTFPVGCTIKWL
ncbi:thioredoxin family protein [bacterium]|nr:thioredoxin family protein [bacterium]|tara:strand:+ start:14846 stop:15355 length:510 start_codon:yes stop_codon:yes gene_type:complete